MYKALAVAALVAGGVLLVIGASTTHSFGDEMHRFFTGSHTDKSVWLLASGVGLCILGLAGLLFAPKATT